MRVPFYELKLQHQYFMDSLLNKYKEVFDDCRFVLGPELEKFEEEFAQYLGVSYALGVASCTDALLLSLKALGIGPGDEVIIPAFGFIADADVVIRSGARLILIDIEKETFNIDSDKLSQAIADHTRAIIVVHLFGNAANMKAITKIAREKKIAIIEDVAQAAGAQYGGQKLGRFGILGCFSFYPTKNLGGAGDGGMIVTNDDKLATTVKMFRDHGRLLGYEHKIIGYNSRLDCLQAAYLRLKLPELDELNLERIENARYYNQLLQDVNGIEVPVFRDDGSQLFSLYTILINERDKLATYLTEQGIGYGIYYPIPLHLQPCLKFLGYKQGDFPISEEVSNKVIQLPNYPGIKRHQIEFVAEKVREFVAQCASQPAGA